MSSILLPRKVLEERRRHNAELMARMRVEASWKQFNRDLQDIDPHLQLVKAVIGDDWPGVKPGYWHVVRGNPDAPWDAKPIEGPNGEYVEPNSRVFELLRKGDLWNDANVREREKRQQAAQEAAERLREQERREKAEEFRERLRARDSVGVSMARAGAWTARAGKRSDGQRPK